MSKTAVVVLVGAGLGVGALILLGSPKKASAKSAPPAPAAGLQFGNAETVQGRSGYVWAVARVLNPGPVASGVKVMAAFLAQLRPGATGITAARVGDIVITYAQRDDDTNARSLLTNPFGASDTTAVAARADFGV